MIKKITLLINLIALIFTCPAYAEWQSLKPMPTPRSEMSAGLLDNKIYVPGGLGGPQIFQAYDLTTDVWQTLAPLPQGRHHLIDRKSTRLNSSHVVISYSVFCLKKK